MSSIEERTSAPSRRSYGNPIVAGAVGNALEWYDFGVYVYLATYMATLFFPAKHASLVLTFSTFAIGYFSRPIGAIVLGRLGDRLGRRATLTITVIVMALATFSIGLLPTYASIGVTAPIMLTILRIIQGLGAGGEWGGAATYIIEHAPPNRRGLVTSWQQVTVLIGTLCGSGVSALLTSLLSHEQMLSYGWRFPFLLGILLGGVGLYMRFRTPETPLFEELTAQGKVVEAPLMSLGSHWKSMLRIVGLTAQWSVSFTFYMNYTPTYLTRNLKFSPSFGLLVTTIAIAFVALFVPFAGLLSDKIGRRPVIAAAGVLTLITTLPLMLLLQHASEPAALLIVLALVIPIILISGTGPATLCELMPTNIRYSGLSIPYSISVAVFAGLTPLVVSGLVSLTGTPLSVTGYVMASAVVGLVTIVLTPEMAKTALR